MTPILPAALENAAECTFPIPEDVGLGTCARKLLNVVRLVGEVCGMVCASADVGCVRCAEHVLA